MYRAASVGDDRFHRVIRKHRGRRCGNVVLPSNAHLRKVKISERRCTRCSSSTAVSAASFSQDPRLKTRSSSISPNRDFEHLHDTQDTFARSSTTTRAMASTQALSAAAQDRKARLAQLKSLKRKQPDEPQDETTEPTPKSPRQDEEADEDAPTNKYISGRNYDFETKGAKLGFDTAPSEDKETLEKKAALLAEETKRQAEEEEKAEKPLDLFKLQPKKPNWDLKRDLERKLEVLNVRTDNAVARLVRERIANQQKVAKARVGGANGSANGTVESGQEGEAAGMEGSTLVEATNIREKEDEEEARREREEEDALLDGS